MALLAESLVEEWLNRKLFFTIRGVKTGGGDMDLLAICAQPEGHVIAWHVEVQVSFRPVGYIAKPPRSRTAKTRSPEEIESCARDWVQSKFRAHHKADLRARLCPGVEWSFHFVYGVVKSQRELEIFESEGVVLHLFQDLLTALCQRSDQAFSTSAGGDFARIVNSFRPTQD